MTRDERVLQDLRDNLREKMLRAIGDYASLCACAELKQSVAMVELMTTLIRLTASFAAHSFHVSPADFAEVMGRQFEYAQRAQEKED